MKYVLDQSYETENSLSRVDNMIIHSTFQVPIDERSTNGNKDPNRADYEDKVLTVSNYLGFTF